MRILDRLSESLEKQIDKLEEIQERENMDMPDGVDRVLEISYLINELCKTAFGLKKNNTTK